MDGMDALSTGVSARLKAKIAMGRGVSQQWRTGERGGAARHWLDWTGEEARDPMEDVRQMRP